MERLVHFTRRRDREEVDDVLLELNWHGRHVLRRANVAHHHENLVLVDQFLGSQHGLLGVVGGVFHQDLELAPVDATLFVDFVHRQQHPQTGLLAKAGNRTGQVLDGSEQNFILAHALLGAGNASCQGERGQG